LARRHARDHFAAVLDHLPRMEATFAAGKPLDDDPRLFIYKHAHRAPPASATTFSAPSFMSFAIVSPNPESLNISCPFSTFVPSMRTTTGSLRFKSFAAATTPDANTSHRRIPPKILMNTPFTLGSFTKILNAFFTCSAEAPPPTSRKLAGDPPDNLMISIVLIARPAPFTMQPTFPSSLM